MFSYLTVTKFLNTIRGKTQSPASFIVPERNAVLARQLLQHTDAGVAKKMGGTVMPTVVLANTHARTHAYITFTFRRGGEVSFVFSDLNKDVCWVLNVGVEEEAAAVSGVCG